MWEDDVLLLSKSQTGLLQMLDNLRSYRAKNGLRVNILKTKIMIVNKSGMHMRRKFSLDQVNLETTREYKYLGFLITPSGGGKHWNKRPKVQSLEGFHETEIEAC